MRLGRWLRVRRVSRAKHLLLSLYVLLKSSFALAEVYTRIIIYSNTGFSFHRRIEHCIYRTENLHEPAIPRTAAALGRR